MKGRYVRLKPSLAFHSPFTDDRVRSTLAKSISTTLKAWGVTAFDMIMWSPVSLRIFDRRTDSSRSPAAAAGAAAAGLAAAGLAAGAAAGAAAAAGAGAAAWAAGAGAA